MLRYLETAGILHTEVEAFLEKHFLETTPERLEEKNHAAADLAYIINLAVRCAPRSVQRTVRRNIVAAAVKDRCTVDMRLGDDGIHRIRIEPIK